MPHVPRQFEELHGGQGQVAQRRLLHAIEGSRVRQPKGFPLLSLSVQLSGPGNPFKIGDVERPPIEGFYEPLEGQLDHQFRKLDLATFRRLTERLLKLSLKHGERDVHDGGRDQMPPLSKGPSWRARVSSLAPEPFLTIILRTKTRRVTSPSARLP